MQVPVLLQAQPCVAEKSPADVSEPFPEISVGIPSLELHLTCPGIPQEVLVLSFTDPLGAALAGDLHAPGMGAVRGGQPDILLAERDAGEAPVQAVALDFAAGLENLPVSIDPAVHLAALLIVLNCK